ncbi:hypothetical protein WJX72_012225 [[Myrmecia] bisecta]|uniref:Uncharacterized protein n=1 Tax=[Myrmecia] bisecta TaxID=41462 RepID=A0AAW1QGZ8_9CHLO
MFSSVAPVPSSTVAGRLPGILEIAYNSFRTGHKSTHLTYNRLRGGHAKDLEDVIGTAGPSIKPEQTQGRIEW